MLSPSDDLFRNGTHLGIRELGRLSALVLAGGRGKRLYPLTKDRAKPAVVFGGIYRIIDFTLSNCLNSGIRRVSVLTQYKSMSLARHIKLGWNILPSELEEFIQVIPAQQRYGEDWYRGTADAVYQNIFTIERENPDFVLILAGDHIYKMDYSKMLVAHIKTKADVTIAVVEMPRDQSGHFGVVQLNSQDVVLDFKEKPLAPECVPGKPDRIFASMGIYIFSKSVLFEELIPGTEDQGFHDFGKEILPFMLGRRRLFGYRFFDENRRISPYWRDIGTLDAFYQANMDLVSVDPQFNLYDSFWPLRTHQRQFPPAKTVFRDGGDGARRGEALDSLISNGCIISGGRVVSSILSPKVRINSYSDVRSSVLMDGVEVGRHSHIKNAIIDKYTSVQPGTVIGYDKEADHRRFTVTENGVVVIPGGCSVGSDGIDPIWIDPVDRRRIPV